MADEALKAKDKREDTQEKAAGKGESLRGLQFVQLVFACSAALAGLELVIDQVVPCGCFMPVETWKASQNLGPARAASEPLSHLSYPRYS